MTSIWKRNRQLILMVTVMVCHSRKEPHGNGNLTVMVCHNFTVMVCHSRKEPHGNGNLTVMVCHNLTVMVCHSRKEINRTTTIYFVQD